MKQIIRFFILLSGFWKPFKDRRMCTIYFKFKGRKKIPLRTLLILLQSHHKIQKSKISSFCPKWRCKFINICFPWFCIIKKLKVLWSRNEIKYSAQQNPWTGFQLHVGRCVCAFNNQLSYIKMLHWNISNLMQWKLIWSPCREQLP